MFESRKERKRLESEFASTRQQLTTISDSTDQDYAKELKRQFQYADKMLARFFTNELLDKAYELGIEVPDKNEWWTSVHNSANPEMDGSYLTAIGRACVARLIRDEKRKNIEWWLKTVSGGITLLIGLAGALIGLISLFKK